MIDIINNLIRNVRLLCSRLEVVRIDDDAECQRVQVRLLHGEVADDIENLLPWGLVSVPLKGAEGIGLSVGGARSNLVALMLGNRKQRLKGRTKGESGLYDAFGDYILLKDGKIIEVHSENEIDVFAKTKATVTAPEVHIVAETKVVMTTPACEISGNLSVGGNTDIGGQLDVGGDINGGGDVSDATSSMQDMRDTYNAHKHDDSVPPPKPLVEDMT